MTTESEEVTPEGWILYDDSCGVCRRWVPFWEGTLLKRGFSIAALQDPWVAERLGSHPGREILQDIRLLFADGTDIAGADVYRFAMKRIWWAYPLYVLSVVPIGRSMFDLCYRRFAAHRHSISRLCGLQD